MKRRVNLAVVPSQKNDYRPHLVRRYGLIAIAFIVIGLQFGYNAATTGNVLGHESDITIRSLLDQTNEVREQSGESTLVLNEKLNQAAYLKAKDMYANQYWAHNAPDGTQPWKWLGDVNYNYSEAGENLAKNFTSTSAVMTAWMNSPEHKANIVKPSYEDVGFAIVNGQLNGENTALVVALYGLSSESAVAGAQKSFSEAIPRNGSGVLTQFSVAIQSITPAAIGGLLLLAFAMIVATIAHTYRRKLPKALRVSWYRHHGIYKMVGLLVFGVVVVWLYGGGQI